MKRLIMVLMLITAFGGCAMFQRPAAAPVVAAPVIHVAPAPSIPAYDFKLGPDMTACLDFEGLVAYQEEQAKLYARLAYFKTLLLQSGAIFDDAPADKAVPPRSPSP